MVQNRLEGVKTATNLNSISKYVKENTVDSGELSPCECNLSTNSSFLEIP